MPRAKTNPMGAALLDDDAAASSGPNPFAQQRPGGDAGAGTSGTSGAAAGGDQVQQVQQQIDRVRGVMQDNVNVMLENIEKGSNLEARSSDLATQAQQFRRTARATSRLMWWQNFKIKLIIGGSCTLAVVIISLIIAGQCGAFDGDDHK